MKHLLPKLFEIGLTSTISVKTIVPEKESRDFDFFQVSTLLMGAGDPCQGGAQGGPLVNTYTRALRCFRTDPIPTDAASVKRVLNGYSIDKHGALDLNNPVALIELKIERG